MSCVLTISVSDTPLPPPAERFAGVLCGIREALALQGVRGALTGWLLILTCSRLNRAGQRVMALAARLAAGTLRPPRVRLPRTAPRRQPSTPAPNPATPPKLLIPRRFGWLLQRVQATEVARCAVANRRSQLLHLLGQPDMLDLIAAAPQVGRHIRPVCRLLGVPLPPVLQRPPRPRPPKPEAARPAPLPAPRPKPPKPPRPRRSRLRTMADYGPPSRPGWERPVRHVFPPAAPRTPRKA